MPYELSHVLLRYQPFSVYWLVVNNTTELERRHNNPLWGPSTIWSNKNSPYLKLYFGVERPRLRKLDVDYHVYVCFMPVIKTILHATTLCLWYQQKAILSTLTWDKQYDTIGRHNPPLLGHSNIWSQINLVHGNNPCTLKAQERGIVIIAFPMPYNH